MAEYRTIVDEIKKQVEQMNAHKETSRISRSSGSVDSAAVLLQAI